MELEGILIERTYRVAWVGPSRHHESQAEARGKPVQLHDGNADKEPVHQHDPGVCSL